MRCNYRVTICIHGNNAAINFDVPVLSLAGDYCFVVKDFPAAECNDIFYIIAKCEITANAIHAHWCRVEFFDIF